MFRYEDPGPISIPTKIQTYTPNNKEITVWRIRHAAPPPPLPPPPSPIQRSAKKGPGLHGVKECLFDVLTL